MDEDFPEETSLEKVKELTSVLSEPEDLVTECSINEDVSTSVTQWENQMLFKNQKSKIGYDSSICIFNGQSLRSLENK